MRQCFKIAVIRSFILLCLFLIGISISKGQFITKSQVRAIYNKSSPEVSVQSEELVTAIAIKCECDGPFYLINTDEPLKIPADPDARTPTFFLSLPSSARDIRVMSPSAEEYTIYLISSGKAPTPDHSKSRMLSINECFEPLPTIPQSEWRTGLPEPEYSRSFHEVNHNIIHHSAGSNETTNYVQVVRDIYIYHTQVNGWSDIGYNYLIAQDGTIFNGRNPDGGSQDKVKGAHFCGSNTGTLGICLLGNYETAIPTSSTIESLESMLTYQLLSQGHDPFESFGHSLGNLGSIAGHRDGCATLCPGENVYSQLDLIRQSVKNKIEECQPSIPLSFEIDTTLIKVGELVPLQAAGSYDLFTWILEGAHPSMMQGEAITASFGIPGNYDVMLIGENDEDRDTLIYKDYIKVSTLDSQPIIFPNPLSKGDDLQIDFKETIEEITIYDTQGKLKVRSGPE